MRKMTDQEKLDAAVKDLAGDFKDLVAEIEASVKLTQNHYGRYMSVIGRVAQGNRQTGQIVALALVKAGANRAGVASARQVSF